MPEETLGISDEAIRKAADAAMERFDEIADQALFNTPGKEPLPLRLPT